MCITSPKVMYVGRQLEFGQTTLALQDKIGENP